MLIEFTKFIWKNVGVGHEVKVLLSIPFLHPDHVEAQSVFAGDLVTLWEMIDLLVLVEALVEIALATA